METKDFPLGMGWVNLLRENAGKLLLLRFLSGKSAAFLAVEIKPLLTRIIEEL